jgi:chromosome segregation ATPase
MKRPASQASIVAKKCKVVASAIQDVDLPDQVKKILASAASVTVGQLKATRSPFNERFVQKIGEVFASYKDTCEKDIAAKEAALAELTPGKGTREAAVDEAKTALAAKTEALEKAKEAVKEADTKLKTASALLTTKKKEQKTGDKPGDEIEKRKASFEETEKGSLLPLVEGTAEPEAKKKMLKAVMAAAKEFKFDATLMEASEKVLEKSKEERGAGFDETCLDQLKDAFKTTIATLDGQLAEGAAAKAARAAAVEEATTAKAAAEKEHEELIAAFTKTKDEKDAALDVVKGATKHLSEFMPDLKKAGDDIDEAKASLASFAEGALVAFAELKDLTEDTYKPPPPPEPEPVVEAPTAEAPAAPVEVPAA